MNLADLSSRDLATLKPLLLRREELMANLAKVIDEIDAVAARRTKSTQIKTKKMPRTKRGALGEAIFALLKAADSKGLHIDEIASKLKREKAAIYAWLYSTGKKKAKKVARATYIAA